MRLRSIAYFAFTLLLISCSNSELQNKIDELSAELELVNKSLDECSTNLKELKNTADNRFIRGKKLFTENKLTEALTEFKGIVVNFKGTQDARIAAKEITTIENKIKKIKIEEERKKALGFKALKPNTKIKYGDLSLRFEKIWKGKRWSFDDYGTKYFLRDAERGNKHILVRVSITSENNNPSLPPIFVYQMRDGKLAHIGTLDYKFRRWKDYGTYLGNYADYGNDFAHSQTIPFNCGAQFPEKELNKGNLYIVLKKVGCFNRVTTSLGNPEISYQKNYCQPKSTLLVNDFDTDYSLLKIL